jgi:hypothetical protein
LPAKKKDEYLFIFFLVFGNRILSPSFAKQNIGGFGVVQCRKESTAGIFLQANIGAIPSTPATVLYLNHDTTHTRCNNP